MGKGGMDYPGQKLSEQIYIYLIPAFGSVAWVFGYFAQDFKITFAGWLVGLVLAMLICVPDWPIFNRHPTPWLEEIPTSKKNEQDDDGGGDAAPAADASSKKSKKAKKGKR
jgi:signal peptidase complex subunit 1